MLLSLTVFADQKTKVHFLIYLTPNMTMSSFFKTLKRLRIHTLRPYKQVPEQDFFKFLLLFLTVYRMTFELQILKHIEIDLNNSVIFLQ